MKTLENIINKTIGKAKQTLRSLAYAGLVGMALVGGGREVRAENFNSVVKDNIEYYMQTDKAVYNLGENVEMLYKVRNFGEEDVVFGFGDQVQHYFKVHEPFSERLVWKWPIVGFPAFSYFVLGPTESKQYIEHWDMTDYQGSTFDTSDDTMVLPGFYEATGRLHPLLLSQNVPVSVQIDIITEPSTLSLLAIGSLVGAGLYTLRTRKK
ncbi:MAG: hypothetical protein Q8N99_06210 [Nanoarchaeota archaeon]|nr:hypothetical protein [Nanoarchaeota archaeon]